MFSQLKKYNIPALFFIAILLLLYSCGKDSPPPSATILTKINGNVVEFTLETVNTDLFEWDFGDGSPISKEKNPIHVFPEFGKEYTVTLRISGDGGEKTITEIVSIRSMTSMEMLSGGENAPNGKRWHLSQKENAFKAMADITLTTSQSLPAGFLTGLGFSNAYLDEFVFKYNGDYAIIPKGQGVIGGLTYCRARNIPNSLPSQEAAARGLTLINPFTPAVGLKFSFSESRNYTINVSDGNASADLILPDVMTLTFSKGGFLGINNWITDCVITSLTEKSMKVALFTSSISPESSQAGKTNGVLIFTFEPSENQ